MLAMCSALSPFSYFQWDDVSLHVVGVSMPRAKACLSISQGMCKMEQRPLKHSQHCFLSPFFPSQEAWMTRSHMT